ncbi:uncharacterized protein LOC128315880 [Acinonyx jubatus]|uniref:Uncharacterized protein LOC128315880 n=1 Tax=Acinonyx jubatus TaxID=32536 RepID=A0ABM3Q6R8_ACIJB|nr:uncharacterized protein LOC128315880 [Acinonyx jubatus]
MKKTSLDLQKPTARSTVPGAPKELNSIKLTHRGCIACPVTGSSSKFSAEAGRAQKLGPGGWGRVGAPGRQAASPPGAPSLAGAPDTKAGPRAGSPLREEPPDSRRRALTPSRRRRQLPGRAGCATRPAASPGKRGRRARFLLGFLRLGPSSSPAAGVSGRHGSRAGPAGLGQRQHHHVAARRRPPPTWIQREREGRCSPLPSPSTPLGPKFRESGDPAPRCGRDPRGVLRAFPEDFSFSRDRGPFAADVSHQHHRHLNLLGNTRARTPGFGTREIPNSIHFWPTSKVVCGRGAVPKVTDPSAHLTTVQSGQSHTDKIPDS